MNSTDTNSPDKPPRKKWVQWLIWIFNAIGFKLGWFACAYGAVFGYYYEGAAVMGVLILLHLWIMGWPKYEIQFMLIVTLAGTVLDTLLNVFDVVNYPGTYPGLSFMAPLWITAIWAGFAVTLDYSLTFLVGRPWLTALLAGIFGPISFWGGEVMGAITFGHGFWPAMIIIGVEWAVLLPILYLLLGWLKKRANVPSPLPQ